jgi:CubicO group peptidase (beta-lactamase class C family)
MLKLKKLAPVLLALTLLLSGILTASCQSRTVSQNLYEKAVVIARTEIWKDINSGKAGSATVAIMEKGEIVYSEGFGMADREKSLPVDKNTLLNIGSITKVFTATAIMLLVDDGKVKLDDPVVKYLPEFVMADPRYEDITVRMLLNHSSGLPGTIFSNNFGFEYNADVFKQTLSTLSQAYLKHAPGAMAPYTNDGFTLAEIIVQRVSGQKFVDFLNGRVFKMLSLKNTGLSIGERPGMPVATYYQPDTGKREPAEVISIIGAGGFSSTAEDLVRFADTFSKGGPQIFSQSALAEMKKAQPSMFAGKLKNPESYWGLGWDCTDIPQYQSKGIQVLGKSGGTMNYASEMLTAPAQRLSVAVIESGAGSRAVEIAMEILNAVLVQKGLLEDQPSQVTKPPEPQDIPAQYSSFAGYYYSPLVRVAFDFHENAVTVYQIAEGQETPMYSLFYNNGYFYSGDGSDKLYFITVDGCDYIIESATTDSISLQKIKDLDNPQSLRIEVNGKQWLRRDGRMIEAVGLSGGDILSSSTIEKLPGYVDFGKLKEIKSAEFAGMPVNYLRDQTELTLININGQTWAKVSERLYSPSDAAAPLKSGINTLAIGADGYNEWLKAEANLTLSFAKPDKGRVIVFSPDSSPIYDSAVDKGEVSVTQGSFVEVSGLAGASFTVTAK